VIPVSDFAGFLVTGLWLFREHKILRHTGEWVDMPSPEAKLEG